MPALIPERVAQIADLRLDKGAHATFASGRCCAMEAVAWLAGEGHTDAPVCASPVLRAFTINLNDQWPAAQRQTLVPFLPRMVGTAGDGKDEARSYLALDWLIRTFAPAWLELAGLGEAAAELRGLRRIADLAAAQAAGPVVRDGKEKASAARDAAQDAAQFAAWDAAQVAAWVAARDAARDAAQFAARDAAWDAARVAAWVAARDAARDAARVAAQDAARDAARVAARVAAQFAAWDAVTAQDAAQDAARVAAWDALRPTVALLQKSALDLLDRMIDPDAAPVEAA